MRNKLTIKHTHCLIQSTTIKWLNSCKFTCTRSCLLKSKHLEQTSAKLVLRENVSPQTSFGEKLFKLFLYTFYWMRI